MSRIFSNIRPWRVLVLLTIFSVSFILYIRSGRLKTQSEAVHEVHEQLKEVQSPPEPSKLEAPPEINAADTNSIISDHDKPVIAPDSDMETSSRHPRISAEPLTIWIDLPNAFPWRTCLVDYNGNVATTDCRQGLSEFEVEYSEKEEERFLLRTTKGDCVTPSKEGVLVKKGCDKTKDSFWVWTEQGQLQWSKNPCVECRKCVSGRKKGEGLGMDFCQQYAEDQNFELGRWQKQEDGKQMLSPLDVERWEKRQKLMRDEILRVESKVVRQALEEIDMDMALHEYDKEVEGQRRRAAVFYVDRGTSGLAMVKWWLYTWRWIGLNTTEQGFDLVMMTHPAMVDKLPKECIKVEEDFKVNYTSPGQCLYKPYLGVAYRDKSYDGYMNSQECLFGPGSEFLAQYSILLRADLDTFPTPHMLNYWPPQGRVVVDIQYSTNHGLENIKQALRELACSVGIEHREWFNMGSTWYGDGRRVRNLAKLTLALNKYGRAQMFGPGTTCRCATCDKLPKVCEWGSGPYAGTLLLYLQEIALNK